MILQYVFLILPCLEQDLPCTTAKDTPYIPSMKGCCSLYSATYQSPIGALCLIFRDGKLINLSFSREIAAEWMQSVFKEALPDERPLPAEFERDLASYFRGQRTPLDWEVELIGTEFQKRVWEALRQIPYGKTVTYKEIGEKCGCRGYRAVGRAVGANPIAIIVPCHRVVGAAGLGGFSGGLNVKRFLLELEGAFTPPLHHA